MGVKIYSEETVYKCDKCGVAYCRKSDDMNFVFATRGLYLGPIEKTCKKCKQIRDNSPYTEYKDKPFIDKVLLHLGFWCKYDFKGYLLTIKVSFQDATESFSIVKILGFILFFIISLFSVYIGLIFTFILNILYIPFGIFINNIKIIKSLKRTKTVY